MYTDHREELPNIRYVFKKTNVWVFTEIHVSLRLTSISLQVQSWYTTYRMLITTNPFLPFQDIY